MSGLRFEDSTEVEIVGAVVVLWVVTDVSEKPIASILRR
jgi:hypothetical protein